MNETMKKERLWNRYFVAACFIFTFSSIAMNMINSTMAKYIFSLYGNAKFSGYLNAAFAVTAVTARIVGGRFTDRIGRRIVIITGELIFSVSVLCFGLFPLPALLILFRALQGFGYSLGTTASNAMGADVLPASRMSEGIGYMGLGQSLATAVGATIALSLIVGTSYIRVFIAAASFLLCGVLLALVSHYEKVPFYQEKHELQKQISADNSAGSYHGFAKYVEVKALPATVTQFFNFFAAAAINSFIVLFADSRGFENSHLFFTFMAAAMIGARLFAGRVSDRHGPLSVIVPTLSVSILAFCLLAFTDSVYIFYLSGFFFGLAQGSVSPTLNASALRRAAPERRGSAAGTYQIANDVSSGLGSVVWGFCIDLVGYTATFIGCILCLCVSMCLAIVFVRTKRI